MTDKERQKLLSDEQQNIVNQLRRLALGERGRVCAKAADEIERLAECLEAAHGTPLDRIEAICKYGPDVND